MLRRLEGGNALLFGKQGEQALHGMLALATRLPLLPSLEVAPLGNQQSALRPIELSQAFTTDKAGSADRGTHDLSCRHFILLFQARHDTAFDYDLDH